MKIFPCSKIKKIDAYTIENEPIASIALMERAAKKMLVQITTKFSSKKSIKIFAGCGNNGGDGLALARMLAKEKYKPEVFVLKIGNCPSEDFVQNLQNLKALGTIPIFEIVEKEQIPQISSTDIVVDAIFGSGLSRPVTGIAKEVIQSINAQRAFVIAIDIPSGLMGEDNSTNDKQAIVKAKLTLSFEFPKLAFFFPENYEYVGKWKILPIGLHPEIIASEPSPYRMIQKKFVKSLLLPRNKFDHKGIFGHGLLISGSYGKMGAAVLGSKATLRSGIGLLTTHVPRLGYEIIQTTVPEAMVNLDESDFMFTKFPDLKPFNAIAVGPGIGRSKESAQALQDLFTTTKLPLILDADAINIISEHPELKANLPKDSILTPHPKEFERLLGKHKHSFTKHTVLREFAQKQKVCILLKGANTAIACPGGNVYYNTTGNAGMATAGSGDVLTGIILSLRSRGYSSEKATIIGVYLHGLAGDLAAKKLGKEALTASDIVDYLPKAWLSLEK